MEVVESTQENRVGVTETFKKLLLNKKEGGRKKPKRSSKLDLIIKRLDQIETKLDKHDLLFQTIIKLNNIKIE